MVAAPSGRRVVTNVELLLVLEFLEVEKNFVGKATNGRPVQGGLPIKKAQGFTLMAAFINDRVPGNLKDWTKTSAKNRFESYMRSFKTAFAWDGDRTGGQTGQGLTAKDIANGITTISAKLDKICFQYERMKRLFQGRQNIDPSHVSEIGGLDSNDVAIPTQPSDVDTIEDVLDEASSASADDEKILLM
ncbi:hypothetical protein AeMF1_005998 [Aphanomyces euteiches]|nr:hypothetical protein AeMF1_005998 [Aphanomyces euteiches]KAH9185380.1 hypothetical protein AeNC1_012644 [Aphanomyces euteiches]